MAREIARTQLPVIDVAGSHREIGRAIGESLREGLQDVGENHQAGLDATVGWNTALTTSRTMIPVAERRLPHCVDELRGMAEGSGVDFEILFTMNALQETRFLMNKLHPAHVTPEEECTSLAASSDATANGHVLLAHNEDANAIRKALPYVVCARPENGPAFVGFAYSGLMLYQGLNENGVGSVGNALTFGDIRTGTPKLFAYRDVLCASYLEDAIMRTHRPERGNGNNHLLANHEGDIYDVEVSATTSALIPVPGDTFVHTNHALDSHMQKLQPEERLLNSIMRQHRVEQLMRKQHGSLTVDSIFEILSDHSNYPRSVCKHIDSAHNPGTETIASLVVDITAGEIHVRSGHPCDGQSTMISLTAQVSPEHLFRAESLY